VLSSCAKVHHDQMVESRLQGRSSSGGGVVMAAEACFSARAGEAGAVGGRLAALRVRLVCAHR